MSDLHPPKFLRKPTKMGRGMARTRDRSILGRGPFNRINVLDYIAR